MAKAQARSLPVIFACYLVSMKTPEVSVYTFEAIITPLATLPADPAAIVRRSPAVTGPLNCPINLLWMTFLVLSTTISLTFFASQVRA